MTIGLPGFDDRLTELLTRQAEKSGETPGEFVRRAVVNRLVQEMSVDPDSVVGKVLRVLQDGVDSESGPAEAVRAFGTPIDDPERLAAVARTGLMDSGSDPTYDRLVAMVADALSAPSAAFTLLDDTRQYFKSVLGLPPELGDVQEVPLEGSVCRYTIDAGRTLVVDDARVHETLKNHPSVQADLVVAYLGVPLTDSDGHSVGTLCVWDQQPRQWTTGHIQTLQDLAWIFRERIFE